jgi:hypothetical protein
MATPEAEPTFLIIYDESIYVVKAPSKEDALEKVNQDIDAELKEDDPELDLEEDRVDRDISAYPCDFDEKGVALAYNR